MILLCSQMEKNRLAQKEKDFFIDGKKQQKMDS